MSAPYEGNSVTQPIPGLKGTNDDGGIGVSGHSETGIGVVGEGGRGSGSDVIGFHNATVGVIGRTSSDNNQAYGVYGEGSFGAGVRGYAPGGDGVQGVSDKFAGVSGQSRENVGVRGSGAATGVFGSSEAGEGVHGETASTVFAAVAGIHLNPRSSGAGVYGEQRGSGPGGFFKSESGEGVHGETHSNVFAAIAGIQLNPESTGAGVYGEHRGTGPAGFFKGKVIVTDDIILTNADCAEEFDFCADDCMLEPGTVAVINEQGVLRQSERAYDKRVAGVISGAGSYRPAIVLDRQLSSGAHPRLPIALFGKVYCKVDAQYGSITYGDLLTPSPTPGHAMKASDPAQAFGAVIGKALRPLQDGRGLIPILIALQ